VQGLPRRVVALAWACLALQGVAAEPDLNGGTWRVQDPPAALRTRHGAWPPLRPEARKRYEAHRAQRQRGDLSFDGTERCLPPGLPRLLMQPQPFEFLQRPEQIVMLYQLQRLMRIIDMPPAKLDPIGPTHLGTSIGHWEQGTLWVETAGFNDQTLLDDAGLPHGTQLKVVERYTPSRDGRTLALRLRIEDPEFYTAPWETQLEFRRDPAGEIAEDVCVERKQLTLWKERQ
jgi:hypothetical protein